MRIYYDYNEDLLAVELPNGKTLRGRFAKPLALRVQAHYRLSAEELDALIGHLQTLTLLAQDI